MEKNHTTHCFVLFNCNNNQYQKKRTNTIKKYVLHKFEQNIIYFTNIGEKITNFWFKNGSNTTDKR